MHEETAVSLIPDAAEQAAGIYQLAKMPEGAFEVHLETLRKGRSRIREIQKSLMVEDVHYGTVPTTSKKTLFKAGAETLNQFMALVATFEVDIHYGDGAARPHVDVDVRCYLHFRQSTGPTVGEGVGNANSFERKYRYRRGERTCPECGEEGTVIKGKAEYGGGWLCWAKKGGCNAKWPRGDKAIEGQATHDVENPDPYDLKNTLVKMAKKRAYVDATLTTTATSDLFTQDFETELDPDERDAAEARGGGARRSAGDAGAAKIGFGKYPDLTLAEVWAKDQSYVTDYLATDKCKRDRVRQAAQQFVSQQGGSGNGGGDHFNPETYQFPRGDYAGRLVTDPDIPTEYLAGLIGEVGGDPARAPFVQFLRGEIHVREMRSLASETEKYRGEKGWSLVMNEVSKRHGRHPRDLDPEQHEQMLHYLAEVVDDERAEAALDQAEDDKKTELF